MPPNRILLIPYRTLSDLEGAQGEGSIDPLGLAGLADHLAEWVLPGMTARMWRPRFLTTMAVSSMVVEHFADEVSADGITPPWLVFEWYYVDAIARLDKDTQHLRRVPGIDKARQARRDRYPLNADRYLKTPKVFGFHGVYKRLARHLDVVDEALVLGQQGYALLRIWEDEQSFSGFSDPDRTEGNGARARRILRDAIREAMELSQAARQGIWAGAQFLADSLLPHRIGYREAKFISDRLLDERANPRGEVFHLVRDPALRRWFWKDQSERALVKRLRHLMSAPLRHQVDVIEAYEEFCRCVQEAWDRLCHLSTVSAPALLRADVAGRDGRLSKLAARLPQALKRAREALGDTLWVNDFEDVARRFEAVASAPDLFTALWEHHQDVQRQKPPDGKRPWFENTDDGGLIIRPPFRLDQAPDWEGYVHPYRLTAAVSFTDDLHGAT